MQRPALLLACALVSLAFIALSAGAAQAGSFRYVYSLDRDGGAEVEIAFSSSQPGSTWLLVPRWLNESSIAVEDGVVLSLGLEEAEPRHTFYRNLSFSYAPGGSGRARVVIRHSAPYAALIEEPRGLFFSTQISTCPLDDVEVEVALPEGSIGRVEVRGAAEYRVSEDGGRVRVKAFGCPEAGRLIVEFELSGAAEYVEVAQGAFRVRAPARYEGLARRVLGLYLQAYPELRSLFGVELEEVAVRLYAPSAEDVAKGVGGFVPFSGGRPGEISLNVFYVRAVNGTMELIAIHELAHCFLWKVGVKPSLLWVHEGLAEYVSIELGKRMGLGEGVGEKEQRLASAALQLPSLGFVQSWRLGQPGDLTPYYAASYMVFRRLADELGGLDFLRSFFSCAAAHAPIDDTSKAVRCLSLAAGRDLTPLFLEWGFDVDAAGLEAGLELVRREAGRLPNWCLPAKLLAWLSLSLSRAMADLGLVAQAYAMIQVARGLVDNGAAASVAMYAALALSLLAMAAYAKGRAAGRSPSGRG